MVPEGQLHIYGDGWLGCWWSRLAKAGGVDAVDLQIKVEVVLSVITCCAFGLIETPSQLVSGSTNVTLFQFNWLILPVGSCNTVITLLWLG